MATPASSPSIVTGSTPSAPRRSGRRAIVAAIVAVLALIWAGYRRLPAGPATGTDFCGPAAVLAATERSSFRVGSFNIHGGEGRDERLDLARTAECLKTLDVVGLNEVYGRMFWESSGQAEALGESLQMPWLFAPAEHRWGHGHFGNAALCRLPVSVWERIPLPQRYGHSCRNALLLSTHFRGRTLRLVITHLDRSDDRERNRQFQAVSALFLEQQEPAILLGDLNTTGDESLLAELLSTAGVHDPLSEILGDKTPRRIDWLLTRGLETVDAGLIDNGASDHPCVWAELKLTRDAERPAR
ncbi:MAG TPA: endonuclease/exonuclease/phosphatase family protein [Pirellulales bacterium]|nr:endonuclease/exonuclease/phosphatase family protein [Pirellulales bacterium]